MIPVSAPLRHRSGRGAAVFWLTHADRERFLAESSQALAAVGSVVDPREPGAETALRTMNPEIVVTGWETPPLDPAWLAAPECGLRYVCHLAGTVRRLVPRSFLERGGLVTNWGGAAASSVAEHALLLALASLRDLATWPQWGVPRAAPFSRTRSLAGKSVGIYGFGQIAQALVGLLRPFDVKLRAFSAGVPRSIFMAQTVHPSDSLEELMSDSDVFFICEALTPQTAGSITAARLELLPPDAVLVNVGRGRLVDEKALLARARKNHLRVAVDVMEHEPAGPESPLCRIPGVVVSPHIGGPTREDYPRIGQAALRNLQRYRQGQPLHHLVTLEIYDRST